MNRKFNKKCSRRGFTLAETLAALVIGSMILIAVLAFYGRAQTGAAGILKKLQQERLPREVLQRIAEDLDRIAGAGPGTSINVANKYQDGLAVARLEISKSINNDRGEPQPLEIIVWQSSIDPDSGQFTLYRSHSGITLEDKLFDEQKEPWQRELFVPVCSGITFFRIEIPQDVNEPLEQWSGEKLPPAITVILSFAEPFKLPDGSIDIPEEDRFVRTMAIDRTRKPTFVIVQMDSNEPNDVNQPADEPNEIAREEP